MQQRHLLSNSLGALSLTSQAPLVSGVSPVSAQPLSANGDFDVSCDSDAPVGVSDIQGSCDPTERKHLTRTGADHARVLLADSGVDLTKTPPVFVLDVGFHWQHEAVEGAWAGQPLDYGGPSTAYTGCSNDVVPAGTNDCDVYFHDPCNAFTTDHGTTVASAAGGAVTGPFGQLPITPYKIGKDQEPKPANEKRHPATYPDHLCLGTEAAVQEGAIVINLSHRIGRFTQEQFADQYPEKPSDFCNVSWWDRLLSDLNARKGVLVITPANDNEDVSTDLAAQPLADKPGTILVGATWRDAPDRWEDTLFGLWGQGSGYQSKVPMVYAPGGDLCLAMHDSVGEWPDASANGVYGTTSGTSFAAPQIAALAAVMKGINPDLSAADIQQIILDTGVAMKDGKHHPGSREVNFFGAVAYALQTCDECAPDVTRCQGEVAQKCSTQNGCYVWTEQQDCAATGMSCERSGGAAECVGGGGRWCWEPCSWCWRHGRRGRWRRCWCHRRERWSRWRRRERKLRRRPWWRGRDKLNSPRVGVPGLQRAHLQLHGKQRCPDGD